MKRVLLMILSVVLVLACVFSLMRVVPGVNDILNIKDYKTADSDAAHDGVAQLEDGIAQLMENEQTYLDGVDTYIDGQAQLAAGRQELAAGQAMIDANTQAYNEGKELIGKMESLMPTIESLASSIQQVRDFNAGIIGGDLDMYLGELRANALNTLANSDAIAALSETLGMDIGGIIASNPEDTSILGNVVNMYYDGLAQLKQYEDGLAQLAAGKQQLAAGEAQLADGDAQLSVFEDGEVTLADGMLQIMMGMGPAYHQKSFEQTVASLPERIAETEEMAAEIPELFTEEGFDKEAYKEFCLATLDNMYQKNEDGEYVCVNRNGESMPLLDLDKCSILVECAKEYLVDSEADVYGEVIPRVVSYALVAIAAVLGIIAGLMGFIAGITGKAKTGKGLGIVTLIFAAGAFVAALISNYTDFIHGVRRTVADNAYSVISSVEGGDSVYIEYSGETQEPIFLVLLGAALLFVVIAAIAKKAAKEKESKEAVAVAASEAAVAGAADSERVSKLEAENAELKAMVAEMAADAATVKE